MTNATIRSAGLALMLRDRRRYMQDDVQRRIRDGRTGRLQGVRDDLEHSDAHIQEEIELALLQMKAEAVTRIDEALVRLEGDQYGSCVECAGEIAERRLRALPFAVRCQACEEGREQEQARGRQFAQRSGGLPLFADVARP